MKYALILATGILCVCLLVIFVLPQFKKGEATPAQTTVTSEFAKTTAENTAQQEKRAAMQQEFERLEDLRQELKKQLGKIKFHLRGVKLPTDLAKETQKTLQNAYKLLRNPKLLGAFYNQREIENEIDKISFSLAELAKITALIATKQEAAKITP